eukprot:TRINITY_DN11211_c0_g1_i1.p1 TRINITY_DN11211_c0_g1~~TRINITY_DN11211_c0_g1_i1.p1  ORF type:complete len:227 (-),score=25.07 TRINITY_DN11211_c0_g1_i1:502-1182(-)
MSSIVRSVQHTFEHAPVVLNTMCLWLVATLLLCVPWLAPLKHSLELSHLLPDLVPRLQLWRLLSLVLFYATPAEAFLAVLLLLHVREVELRLGSRKLLTVIGGGFLVSLALLCALMTIFPSYAFHPGPYPVLFFSVALYAHLVPKTGSVRICCIHISDKGLFYVLAAQLALSHGMSSLLPSAVGMASGFVWLHSLVPECGACASVPGWLRLRRTNSSRNTQQTLPR